MWAEEKNGTAGLTGGAPCDILYRIQRLYGPGCPPAARRENSRPVDRFFALEDTATKRIAWIALLMSLLLIAGCCVAEESMNAIGEPGQTEAGAAASGEEEPAEEDPAEPGEEEPAEEDPTEPGEEEPAEEDPAAPGGEDPVEEDPTDPGEADPSEEDPTEPGNEEPPAEEEPVEHLDSHQTELRVHGEPAVTCTDSGTTHTVTTVYDLYCLDCGCVIREIEAVEETEEEHTLVEESKEPTCMEDGYSFLRCTVCGYEGTRTIRSSLGGHSFVEYPALSPICGQRDGCPAYRVCAVCGVITDEEGEILDEPPVIPAPEEHQFELTLCEEPTCTQPGRMVRTCVLCGAEETVESPPLGHTYAWVTASPATPGVDGWEEYRCVLCGDVANTAVTHYAEMMYNNTATSFGPTTRELVGGTVWNRVTPIDLSADGVFTYPLVASNLYVVGTVSVVRADGWQVVTYALSAKTAEVLSENLTVYPNLESLKTGENAVRAAFGEPIDLNAHFHGDSHVILGVTLKMNYDALGVGVHDFTVDQAQLDAMMAMID